MLALKSMIFKVWYKARDLNEYVDKKTGFNFFKTIASLAKKPPNSVPTKELAVYPLLQQEEPLTAGQLYPPEQQKLPTVPHLPAEEITCRRDKLACIIVDSGYDGVNTKDMNDDDVEAAISALTSN